MHRELDDSSRQEDFLEEMMCEGVFIKLSVALSEGECISGGKTGMCNKSALGDYEWENYWKIDGCGWVRARNRHGRG